MRRGSRRRAGKRSSPSCAKRPLRRRAEIIAGHIFANGRVSAWVFFANDFYWWPILPVVFVAAWVCRRERWFTPVFFFGSFLSAGTMAGLLLTRMGQVAYVAPLEFGLYLLAGVCVTTLALRANAALGGASSAAEGTHAVPSLRFLSDASADSDSRRGDENGA